MGYIVYWKRSATERLAEIWLDSADRLVVTVSVAEFDRLLAGDPHQAGESRSGAIRILFVPPLGVFFEIDETSQTVQVLRVWSF